MTLDINLMFGSLLIVMLYTRTLYKDNFAYDIAEHLTIGAGGAYLFVNGYKSVIDQAINPLLAGNYILIIPIILGLVLYSQLSEKTRVFSRYPLAIIVGVGIGLTLRRVLSINLTTYIGKSFRPILGVSPFTAFNNALMLLGTICGILYFIMGREQKGRYGLLTKIGRLFLMVTFGAYFGTQVMARMTILSGRIEYILIAFGLIS